MKQILVTGSIAYDVLLQHDGSFTDAIKSDNLEELSVSFFSPHFARHHGGTAANVAWNLRLLNQETMIVGTVGNDGGEYLRILEERKISTDHIEQLKDHVTATAIIGTDTGERQIAFFHPGADAHGTWPDLSDEREDIAYGHVGAHNTALMMAAAKAMQSMKIPWMFDPGQAVIRMEKADLLSAVKGSDCVVVNAFEWSSLSQKLGTSVDAFLKLNPLLIVTQGEEGLTIHSRKDGTKVLRACKPEKLVNPTGAGDAMRAGILTGLSGGWTVEQSAQLGASIASFVVEQEGTLLDSLDLNEILGRAEVTYGEVLPELP